MKRRNRNVVVSICLHISRNLIWHTGIFYIFKQFACQPIIRFASRIGSFLINYVYILLIPLVGFGIIKFFQKFAFNPKNQAATRVQKSECLQCARKIRQQDSHCPHCGYAQYAECLNCHDLTYKNLPYCKQCGQSQNLT